MKVKKLPAATLRRHKGISFVGVTTVFICHDGQGKIFLAKRSKLARDEHGRWDPGGGGLKHGQTIEGNLRRELQEEYGVEPLDLQFLDYFDAFRRTPEGQPTHWLAMCFAVKIDPQKVVIGEPEMFDDYGWFSLDSLPSPLHSQFRPFMGKFGERLRVIIGAQ